MHSHVCVCAHRKCIFVCLCVRFDSAPHSSLNRLKQRELLSLLYVLKFNFLPLQSNGLGMLKKWSHDLWPRCTNAVRGSPVCDLNVWRKRLLQNKDAQGHSAVYPFELFSSVVGYIYWTDVCPLKARSRSRLDTPTTTDGACYPYPAFISSILPHIFGKLALTEHCSTTKSEGPCSQQLEARAVKQKEEQKKKTWCYLVYSLDELLTQGCD